MKDHSPKIAVKGHQHPGLAPRKRENIGIHRSRIDARDDNAIVPEHPESIRDEQRHVLVDDEEHASGGFRHDFVELLSDHLARESEHGLERVGRKPRIILE